LYYDDEKKYPMNAAVLLPNTENWTIARLP
jgi:hypothetical protein